MVFAPSQRSTDNFSIQKSKLKSAGHKHQISSVELGTLDSRGNSELESDYAEHSEISAR